jgi:hypothetical protein
VLQRGDLAVACNLGAGEQRVPLPGEPASIALTSASGATTEAHAVRLPGESVAVVALQPES